MIFCERKIDFLGNNKRQNSATDNNVRFRIGEKKQTCVFERNFIDLFRTTGAMHLKDALIIRDFFFSLIQTLVEKKYMSLTFIATSWQKIV